MIPAVGYCRFSSENQADGFSIEAQKAAIEEFASRSGYSVVRFYVDEAKSGTTTEGRTAFLEMLSDSKSGGFRAVIVHKLDRFARSRIDSAVSKKVLKDNGVSLVSVLEHLDDSPESIILESVLEGMSEYYSKNLSRETKKGMRVAGSKGRILGTIPYGYVADSGNRFKVVEEEAELVRFMFSEYAKGVQMQTLVREVRDKGYRTRRGNLFSACTIAQLLKNETFVGRYRFGSAVYRDLPAIIDEDTFQVVQKRFNDHKRVRPKDKGTIYLLTGLIYHSCGEPMVGYKSIKKGVPYYYYRCKAKEPGGFIRKDAIEKAVVEALVSFVSDEKTIARVTKALNREIQKAAKTEDAKKLREELAALKDKDSKLLDLYLAGTIEKPLYEAKKEELDVAIKLAENKLAACLYSLKIAPDVLKAAFSYYAYRIKNGLDEPNSVQATINAFVKKVEVLDESIRIAFNFESKDSVVAYKRVNAPALPRLVATYSYSEDNGSYKLTFLNVVVSSLSSQCCCR